MEYKEEKFATANGVYDTMVPQGDKKLEKWVRPNPKLVHSFIPGTITEVVVKAGDTVKQGDKLLMFNAMKMANTLASPVSGTIKSVAVAAGDIVPNGALLVEFE